MTELSTEERCRLAVGLIEQAPPGEVNDVVNDIRTIIGDDSALMPHISPTLRLYNLAQLHVISHSAVDDVPDHTSLLSNATVLPGSSAQERFVDAEGKRSFVFDHVLLTAGDFEPYVLPEEEETFRAELAKSLAAYTKNHFPAGHSSVSCSQHPILPPSLLASGSAAAEPEAKMIEDPVTDVVPEQMAAGDAEPVSTPAVGDLPAKKEEVDQPGGLVKVDELIGEAKKEEEGAQSVTEDTKDESASGETATAVMEEPRVEESKPEEEPMIMPRTETSGQPIMEERKQERVENPLYNLEVVGNRYNPSNFWTGRWRTQWIVDRAAEKVEGAILVDVHYYEQGNVQLATKHTASFPCPAQTNGSQSIASQIVTTISNIETAYHLELNDVYGELGEKAFRALRRALPVTRQKMEWEKVSGYTLGADLTKATA